MRASQSIFAPIPPSSANAIQWSNARIQGPTRAPASQPSRGIPAWNALKDGGDVATTLLKDSLAARALA